MSGIILLYYRWRLLVLVNERHIWMTERDVVDLRRLERCETDFFVDTERGLIVHHCVGHRVHVKCQIEAFVWRLTNLVERLGREFGGDRSCLIHDYQLILVLVRKLHIELIE